MVGPSAGGCGTSPSKQRKLPAKAFNKEDTVQPKRRVAASTAVSPPQIKKRVAKALRPPFAVDIPTSPVFSSPLDVVGLSQVSRVQQKAVQGCHEPPAFSS